MEGTFLRPAWRRYRASLHLALLWPPKTAAAENEKACFITRAQGKDIQRHVFKHSVIIYSPSNSALRDAY